MTVHTGIGPSYLALVWDSDAHTTLHMRTTDAPAPERENLQVRRSVYARVPFNLFVRGGYGYPRLIAGEMVGVPGQPFDEPHPARASQNGTRGVLFSDFHPLGHAFQNRDPGPENMENNLDQAYNV